MLQKDLNTLETNTIGTNTIGVTREGFNGITRLDIHHYRSYEHARIKVYSPYIILVGPNGAGKTNLIEAISLFSSTRGFRKADLEDLGRANDPLPWGVALQAIQGEEIMEMGTGLHASGGKRVHRINGQSCSKSSQYSDYLNVLWLTPAMDGLLIGPPEERRRFLDRLVCGFDATHAKRLQQYYHALRQRSFLLKQPSYDARWIKSLEEIMAAEGVAVTASRLQMIDFLQHSMNEAQRIFPQADFTLEGKVEEWVKHMPSLEAEEKLCEAFFQRRSEDRDTGGASEGPHRSDWIVYHREKKIAAFQCSMGEQKALLISIILAFSRLQKTFNNRLNILLLDDVVAHLDRKRQEALFEEIKDLKMQTWITGTDITCFASFKENAQFLNIKPGIVDEKEMV
jgi:DNA replication and repair protein RecF